jgi:hypothetical protein
MQWLKRIVIAVVIVCVGEVCTSDAIMTVGSSVDNTPPVAPTGLCSGSFTMSSQGFFSTATDSSQITVGIGALENLYEGKGYVILGDTGALTTQLYQFNLNSLVQDTVVTIDTNPSVPDSVSSHSKSSYYDTNAGKMVVVGNTTALSCTGSTQGCVHLRQYSGVTLGVDNVTASGTDNVSPAPSFGSTFDLTRIWIPYRVTPIGTQLLGEYSGFLLSTTATLTATSNYINGVSNDSTYVYATQMVGPSIIRLPKSNINVGATTFSPGFAASATTILQPPYVDESGGWLYIGAQSKGVVANFMYRVQLSTMTIIDTITLGVTQLVGKALIDTVNNKVYLVINSGGTTNQIIRVERTGFTSEATFNGGASANGINIDGAQIDVIHQKIYVPINGTGGGGVAKVEKVNLCS